MRYKPYRLTGNHKELAETGDVPAKSRKRDLLPRIEEKVELLPDRVDALCSDVASFYEGGFLAPESYTELWFDLLGVDKTRGINDQFGYSEPSDGFRDKSIGERWGYKLGIMIRQLHSVTPRSVDYEEFLQNILWGIHRAFSFEVGSINGDASYGSEFQRDTLEEFSRRWENELRAKHERQEWFLESRERHDEQGNALKEHVADVLVQTGHELDWEKIKTETGDQEGNVESTGELQFSFLVDKVCAQIEIDGAESPSENEILQVVNDQKLVEKRRLNSHLKRDFERLRDSGHKPSAQEVLDLMDVDRPVSSREIARKLSSKGKDWHSRVTERARNLAAQDSPRGETWSDRPLLTGDKEGWELTPYGKAIFYLVDLPEFRQVGYPVESLPEKVVTEATEYLEL